MVNEVCSGDKRRSGGSGGGAELLVAFNQQFIPVCHVHGSLVYIIY